LLLPGYAVSYFFPGPARRRFPADHISRLAGLRALPLDSMGRHRRRREASLLDLIPPIGALIALGFFFVPGFREFFGALVYLVIGLVVLAVVGLIAWVIWRRTRKPPELSEASAPNVSAPQPRPYRAASGFVNLMSLTQAVEPEWTRELLSRLEWKRFEDVVAAYSEMLGYKAKTTRIGADGGVDVQLFQAGQPSPAMIIQCKAWDAYKVGVKPVRELFGVMAADKVVNGAFFTTGEFTTEAEEWARDKSLDLVDGREFITRIGQLTPDQQSTLLALATEGDYTTPTCPSCGVKMVQRTATKGRSEGSSFWGCRNYPRCKQTFRMPGST
jgi:restriction system protein